MKLVTVVRSIIEVWTGEITNILQERKKTKVPTECTISDMVRGKIIFRNVEDLFEAVEKTDELCKNNGYTVI